jgi:hypothetical protein
MKTVDPARTVSFPSKLDEPAPEGWTAMEKEGGIELTVVAREQIANAFLTYVVSGVAVAPHAWEGRPQEIIH